jgi:hypothetical protein
MLRRPARVSLGITPKLSQARKPIVLVVVLVLVLDFGLQLVSQESRANPQRLHLRKRRLSLSAAPLPGSAMLLHPLDGVTADARHASSLLRFGGSPDQVFEDEYD